MLPALLRCARSLPVLFTVLGPLAGLAQVPSQCLEIESILVDACSPASLCPTSSEGENEMVRFVTGPGPIAVADLEADWPNGTWRGVVQNATTAQLATQLDATIESCGHLLEPPGGVIPPGSHVILVTSTDMCVSGNSFATLADTVYLIFQDAGNTQGHFANSPAAGQPISPVPPAGTSERRLILFDNATGCSDTAIYVREQLVNVLGTYGGQAGESDGARAVFSWPGEAQVTYVNNGCQAPFEPLFVQASANGVLCDGAGTVDLLAEVVGGSFTSVQWTGGTGTFSDPTSLVTTYTAGPGDVDPLVLTLCALTDCADPICGSVTVANSTVPTIGFDPVAPLSLCPGQTLVVTAFGADGYVWSSGEATPSITASAPGTYTVTGTNACGSSTVDVEVAPASTPEVSITGDLEFCQGGATTLTATGAPAFLWSDQSTGPSITVTGGGLYSVTGTNACGTGEASVVVTVLDAPQVSITGEATVCPGGSTTLTASGADTYAWNTGVSGAVLSVNTPGTYTVTGATQCGSNDATIEVTAGIAPAVEVAGEQLLCPGGTVELTATSNSAVVWNTGATGSSIVVGTPGLYVVTATNSCGSANDAIQVDASPLEAAVTAQPLTGGAPLTVVFQNNTVPANAGFTWDFDDGTGNSTSAPTHLFDEPGVYNVVLTATSDGCTSVANLTITVVAPVPGDASFVSVPNVFTPNGDRTNDVLLVNAFNIVDLDMAIYNRWGQKVNELLRKGEVWDGRSFAGEPVPDGTYFYTLRAEGSDGRSHELSGHISLLR